MSNRYHVEAWSLPFATTAQVIARVPFIQGSFDTEVGRAGRGSITLRADYPLLDSIIDETGPTATYLRVYQDNTLIPEASFFAKRLARNLEDQAVGTVKITGPGFDHIFDWAQLENFDYPEQPTVDPIWRWGDSNEAGTWSNGSLDDNPDGLDGNGGFELGTISPWGPVSSNAYFTEPNSVATTTVVARTGTVSMLMDAQGRMSGARANLTVVGGKRYQFQAYLREDGTASGDEYWMGVKWDAGTIHSANGFAENGYAWRSLGNAAKGAGASTTAWQVIDLDVTFGSEQTSTEWVIVHVPSGQPTAYIDDVSVTGPGIGLEPWVEVLQTTNGTATPTMTTFDIDNARVANGTYSLKFAGTVPTGSTYYKLGVGQVVTGLVPGRTYTFTASVSHDAVGTEDFRLVVQRPNGEWVLTGTVGTFTVPTGTGFTKSSVSFVADTTELWIQVRWGATGPDTSPNIWVDAALLAQGQAADTVGGIWQQILDDATTDHTGEAGDLARNTLGFLDYTGFTDALDSDANAWTSGETDGTISYQGQRGKRFARIKADHEKLGYELRIIDSSSGPVMEAYNPYDYTTRVGGYGTDRRTTMPPLRYRSGVTGGPVVVQVITPNIVHVEGADGLWERKKATTTLDAYELYQGEDDLTSIATVTDLVDRVLEERNDPTLALKLKLAPVDDPAFPIPWTTFRVGDTIPLDLETDFVGDKRVVKVTTNFTPGYGEYELEFDQTTYTSDPMKAVVEAVRRLLDQVADLLEPEADILAGAADLEEKSPWDATFTVASYQTTDLVKANADFICDGSNDDVEINLALTAASNHGKARVILSDGDFDYNSSTLTVPSNGAFYGLAQKVTRILSSGTLTITLSSSAAWGRLTVEQTGE